NYLIAEQRDYDQEEQQQLAAGRIPYLNQEQKSVFDAIVDSVQNQYGHYFCVHGSGGTGKTFLCNTICYALCAEGQIVLCVALSGIASLLLLGGHTVHSHFKILIQLFENSTYNIGKQTMAADLIQADEVVI
ncbi:hypothetical protein CONPUDRAFT_30488, partial [Coniophora puteana RWD-64-598 SS2]